ncbi:hypothetical protein Tco_0397314 [Tanacetum coccineum]
MPCGNPSLGGVLAYYPHEGYTQQAPMSNYGPNHNGPMYLANVPPNSYPFYTQLINPFPNASIYPSYGPTGLFTDSVGCMTPFVHWIKDYPLPDGLKIPSHMGSYDGKGDPDNYLHLFEGFIHLPTTYKGLMEKTYTWIKAKEVATKGASSDHKEGFDSPREILTKKKVAKAFEQPPRMVGSRRSRDMSKYCHFHEDHRHETNQCRELRHQIEEAKRDKDIVLVEALILMISRGSHASKRKCVEELVNGIGEITFPHVFGLNNSSDPVIVKVQISGRQVNWAYMDSGSSCEVIYKHCFLKLKPSIRALRVDSKIPLIGFSGEHSKPLEKVPLEVTVEESPYART